MRLHELTARERQLYYMGYAKGKSDGKHLVGYLLVGFILAMAAFLGKVLHLNV